MSRAKMIDFYLEKLDNEELDISEVRKELERNNIDQDEIRVIIRMIDNELQRRLLTKSENSYSNQVIWAGLTLTLVGAVIMIATYSGILPMGNSFLFVYGPILGGLSISLMGLARKKRA